MSLHIYPDSPPTPQNVAKGASWTATIEQLTSLGGTERTMYLRVAMSASACAALTAPIPPTLSLQADEGEFVALTDAAGAPWPTVSLFRKPGHEPQHYVADAHAEPDPDYPTVIQIIVTFYDPPGLPRRNYAWQLKLQNNDAVDRTFTWVVAGSEAETRQPWLALPSGLDFNQSQPFISVGGEALAQVQVCNRGAGPLALERVDLTPGAGFAVAAPWPPRLAPSQGAALAFRLTPVAPGVHQATCTVVSNDPSASTEQPTPAHNNRITLQATVAGMTALDRADWRQGDERRPATISGYRLAQTQAVVFSGSGVTAHLDQTRPLTDTQVPIVLTIAPDATLGSRTFTLKTAEGDLASGSVPFTVYERAITALSADMGHQGDLPRLITLTGEGLAEATQVDLVLPNGDVDTKVTVVVETQAVTDDQIPVTLTIAQDATPGERTIHIAGQTWRIVGSKPFTVNRRLMTKIEDSQGRQGDEQCGTVISGEGLAEASTVSFLRNGEVDLSVTASVTAQPATDNQIPVAITVRQDAVLGARTIRVAGPQWQIDSDKVFTVAPRSVIGITSTIGCQGDTKRDAIITGEGLAGAKGVSFLLNGEVDAKIKAAVDPQQVTDQQIPVMIAIDQNAAIGAATARTLRVTGPTWRIDAGAGIPFSVVQMKIKSITPNWGNRGEQIASTITGAHLAGVEAVTFSGKTVPFPEHRITAQIVPGGNDTTVPVSIAIGRHAPLAPARDFTVRTQWGAVAHSGVQKFDVHLHNTEMLGTIKVLCTLTRQALLEGMAKQFLVKGYMGQIENTYADESTLGRKLITMVLAGDSPDLAITLRDYQFPATLVRAKGTINRQEFYIYANATTLSNKLQVAAFREFLLQ